MLMEVTCRCGWSTRGSESAVIAGIQGHAKTEHDLRLSAADVRAVWRVVAEGPPIDEPEGG
jgi:hypothetical protein